ncbi:MAG: porin [Pseudomonadales bacterium]|nr:porin [Pseudomonadales bacterium]
MTSKSLVALAGSVALACSPLAYAQAEKSDKERIAELERKIEILAEEIEGERREALVVEQEYNTQRGVGPAGSKIYQASESSVTIGGYGEAFYLNSDDEDKDEADFLRNVLYFGYRFSDRILFNSEIEIEHADEIYLEFAYLDFLFNEHFNVRAGMMLTPLGFVNEVHEPQFFFGNLRPPVETQIIPSTTRENGVGIYGRLGGQLDYRLYVQNSFNGDGISSGNLRGVRQKGSNSKANDLALTGRLDWNPAAGVTLGGSFWTGNMGHEDDFAGEEIDMRMNLFDLRAQYRYGGLQLRALYTHVDIDDTLPVSQDKGEAIGEEMEGWYVEAGYDIFTLMDSSPDRQSLYPWIRYSEIDTQASIDQDVVDAGFEKDGKNDRSVLEVGLHYMPHPNVVIKGELRDWDSDAETDGDGTNNQRELVLGIGYNF